MRAVLDHYASGRADFADYLVCESAQLSGATAVVSFDEKLVADQRVSATTVGDFIASIE